MEINLKKTLAALAIPGLLTALVMGPEKALAANPVRINDRTVIDLDYTFDRNPLKDPNAPSKFTPSGIPVVGATILKDGGQRQVDAFCGVDKVDPSAEQPVGVDREAERLTWVDGQNNVIMLFGVPGGVVFFDYKAGDPTALAYVVTQTAREAYLCQHSTDITGGLNASINAPFYGCKPITKGVFTPDQEKKVIGTLADGTEIFMNVCGSFIKQSTGRIIREDQAYRGKYGAPFFLGKNGPDTREMMDARLNALRQIGISVRPR